MKEKIVSRAYAKAMSELASQANIDIAKEMTELSELINKCNDLENVLFLQLFSNKEKTDVLNELFNKSNLSDLLKNFLAFLIDEGRIGLFPLIFKEVIIEDDNKKGFLKGTVEGVKSEITEEALDQLSKYLEKETSKKVELIYQQNKKITAGYKVTVEDLQLDASIDKQLETFKEQVLND